MESGEAAASACESPANDQESGEEDPAKLNPDEEVKSRSRPETPMSESKAQSKGKKRKISTDKADKIESLFEKVIKMQSDSEQRLEEKMLEMEEQIRKETHEFQ